MGPGTKAMLIGVAALGIYSFYTRPSDPRTIYYEADQSGTLRQVEKRGVPAPSPPPLWKPEPQLLIRKAVRLGLSSAQQEQIVHIAERWNDAKASLLDRMNREVPEMSSGGGAKVSVSAVRSDLLGYSELSRTYDETRSRYWRDATALLSEPQRKVLSTFAQEAKP